MKGAKKAGKARQLAPVVPQKVGPQSVHDYSPAIVGLKSFVRYRTDKPPFGKHTRCRHK